MRTGLAIITSTVLALGVAGSILAIPAMSPAAQHAPSVHVQADAPATGNHVFYHA